MDFKESIKIVKLDFTSLVIVPCGGSGEEKAYFEISPKEFLRYAKDDFNSNYNHKLINSLTNAKRAIDCQIDEVLTIFGISYNSIPNQSKNLLEIAKVNNKLPYKLQLIQALNLAPGFIVAKARSLRNKLEHHYSIPSKRQVQESIDIAELFIRSIEGKTKIIENEFVLSDKKNYSSDWNYDKGYSITFDLETKKFILRSSFNSSGLESFEIRNTAKEFYGFLRLMNSIEDEIECEKSFQYISIMIDHETPVDKIKMKRVLY